jgi:hypothetical protein
LCTNLDPLWDVCYHYIISDVIGAIDDPNPNPAHI